MSPTIDTNAAAEAELETLHTEAESRITTYSYARQQGESAKSRVSLARTDLVNAVVQIVKKDGGENNLHYHTAIDTFWMVLKGRVRFYGPGDELIGEFGPMEGTVTPRYSRYWFENAGDEELELLQVAGSTRAKDAAPMGGRTDVAPQRFKVNSSDRFSAER